MEIVELENSKYMLRSHDAAKCKGERCVLHNKTDHPMRSFPQHWRTSWGGFMERTCPHGIGHPDPDDVHFLINHKNFDLRAATSHGCDGCCAGSYDEFKETK